MSSQDQETSSLLNPTLELASCQAALAFERTLVSLDQFLMGAIRTSLALVTFGFAVVLFFQEISVKIDVSLRVPARNFGLSLVLIGIGLVVVGIVGHRKRFNEIKSAMDDLHCRKLLPHGCPYRRSSVAIFAGLLLLVSLLVLLGVLVRVGPFG